MNNSTFFESNQSKEEDMEINMLPNLTDVIQINFGPLIKDKPSDYQIEAYIACLLENTICYMPSESSKFYL